MPEVDVRLVDVVKRFGDAAAVDHINLEVQDGEFFSLLGPSGCGKTTTLRMIGGFEQPTSGLIELQGQDVTWLPPYKRNVNTVFQNYALFPHLTIYENVAFGLQRKGGLKDGEIKSRVTEMLKLVELPGFEKRKPTQISGGQAQRVALARALINRPAVLLLDEPLGRARPQAAQADAGRAQADPAGGRDHVHLRDPRPGRGDDDVRSHRRHEQGPLRAAGRPGEPVRAARRPASWPASWASATCCRARSPGPTATTPSVRFDGRHDRPGPEGAGRRSAPRSTSASGRRRSGCTPSTDPDRRRREPAARRHQGRLLHRRQHPVHRRGAWRSAPHGVRAERRAGDPGRALAAGRGGPADLVAGPLVRRPRARPGDVRRLTTAPARRAAAGSPEEDADDRRDRRPASRPDPAALPAGHGPGRLRRVPGRVHRRGGRHALASPAHRRAGRRIAGPDAAAGQPDGRPSPPTPKVVTGPLKFANWARLHRPRRQGRRRRASTPRARRRRSRQFKKKYKVDVDYEEKIEDNQYVLRRRSSPALVAGVPTGWDLIVITDWLAAQVISKGWAEQIDQTNVPNCVDNLRDAARATRPGTPSNDYHYPWQSGMTGIGYNAKSLTTNKIAAPTKPGRPVGDQAVQGRVPRRGARHASASACSSWATIRRPAQDDRGRPPEGPRRHRAAQGRRPARSSARTTCSTSATRSIWAAMVWSGDLASSGSADDKFVFPDGGDDDLDRQHGHPQGRRATSTRPS